MLSNAACLRDEPDLCHVYIRADESLQDRRHKMLLRLKARACQAGKIVELKNESELFVDNMFVFSLAHGFVNNELFASGVQVNPTNGSI